MKFRNKFVRDIHRKQLQRSSHEKFHKSLIFIEIFLRNLSCIKILYNFPIHYGRLKGKLHTSKILKSSFPVSCFSLYKYTINSSYIAFRYIIHQRSWNRFCIIKTIIFISVPSLDLLICFIPMEIFLVFHFFRWDQVKDYSVGPSGNNFLADE